MTLFEVTGRLKGLLHISHGSFITVVLYYTVIINLSCMTFDESSLMGELSHDLYAGSV